jgi:hypothetical protein
MAKRQDTGSNSAHENQQPTSHNEDAVPEMTDVRGRADEDEGDEFEEEEDAETLDEEEDEGNY